MTHNVPPTSGSFTCDRCGGALENEPGWHAMRCPHCQYEQIIAPPTRPVVEHWIGELGSPARRPVGQISGQLHFCPSCGAGLWGAALSEPCRFCDTPLVSDPRASQQIMPEAVLPFSLSPDAACEALRRWVRSPLVRLTRVSSLRQVTRTESLTGLFVPFWTFDAWTTTHYAGYVGEARGVVYQGLDRNGCFQLARSAHTHLTSMQAGTVSGFSNDVTYAATTMVDRKVLRAMEPWPMERSVAFRPDYLAGHRTLRYNIEPEVALNRAKFDMADNAQRQVRMRTGLVCLDRVTVKYANGTYKLMLVPLWMATYVYRGKTYRIAINATTGKARGIDAPPVSRLKVLGLVAIFVAALCVMLSPSLVGILRSALS